MCVCRRGWELIEQPINTLEEVWTVPIYQFHPLLFSHLYLSFLLDDEADLPDLVHFHTVANELIDMMEPLLSKGVDTIFYDCNMLSW